jgi:predicted RNA-binding Zn ribbon-like protein
MGRYSNHSMLFDGQDTRIQAALDDSVWRREQEAPQPGTRAPAPGQLALLQAFLNSHFDLVDDWGADLLASRTGLRSWLADRALLARGDRVTEADVARTLTVREGLRQVIAAQDRTTPAPDRRSRRSLDRAAAGASFELRFSDDGPRLTPAGARPLDRALATLLAIAMMAMLDGSWERLKSCPGHHCGWVFYDRSRNNSGRWCSMTVCGGREKSRAHYRRHRTRGD